jgi:hypothetical protein
MVNGFPETRLRLCPKVAEILLLCTYREYIMLERTHGLLW